MKVLIIEDDHDIAKLIEYNLAQENITAEISVSGHQGISKARRINFDLLVLDLMLPDMSGLDVCKTLRDDPRTRHLPILMLTAKGEEIDRVVGFEVGADDYLTKPFSPRELTLRVKAIVRRVKESGVLEANIPVSSGCVFLDPSRFSLKVEGSEVSLTALEFKLLHFLMVNKGRVATRDQLLDHVWGYDAALTTRTVDTHIRRLREKMGKASENIETIRGIGYRYKDALD